MIIQRFKGTPQSGQVFTACLLAFAVMFASFIHQPVISAQDNLAGYDGVVVADYTLPDGSLPDICFVGSPHEHAPFEAHCPLCIISAHIVLPQSPDIFAEIAFDETHFAPEPRHAFPRLPLIASVGARAPPLLTV